jgi:hypothetical protein
MLWKPKTMLALALSLLAAGAQLEAQGKGKGKDKEKEKGGESRGQGRGNSAQKSRGGDDNRGRGNANARANSKAVQDVGGAVALPRVIRDDRGKGKDSDKDSGKDSDRDSDRVVRGRLDRVVFVEDLRPTLRPFFVSRRAPDRVIVGAVSRAQLRGVGDDALVFRPTNDRLRLLNRSGVVLLDLDENRARDVGKWDVIALDDHVKNGAPSFCRSGAGHPVYGREWCIEKGFGLGSSGDWRWGRTPLEDVVFVRPVTTNRLVADALLNLLGSTAFDRLALHAITLGLLDPLAGSWLDDPSGPRVLLVSSGSQPVAEIVDRNRDDRAEVLLVTRKNW